MYYSYVEIEYVATSFSPARMDLALKLLSLFQEKMCRFHYGCAKGKSGSDWDPTITRVMGMDMLGFEVLAYLGMAKINNGEICVDCPWDDVFAISGVCKSWREASFDYLI
jgi:hypothetical protein